MFQTVSRVKYL